MRVRRNRHSGFTLLELLVSMTLFVLIAGTAYAALRSAARTWERTDARARADGETRLVLDYLSRWLATAFPLAVQTDDRWRPWFEGTRDRLVFLVEGSRHVGLSGLFQVIVRHDAEARPPGVELVLQRVHERLKIGEVRGTPLRRLLLEDVVEVEFTFFGRRNSNDEPAWYPEWRDAKLLPKLVRLRFQGGDVGEWPALTVRLPVDGLRFLRMPAEGVESPLRHGHDEGRVPLAVATETFRQ